MPQKRFAESTFPAPDSSPPMVLARASSTKTPASPLPKGAAPVRSVPMKLPWMTLPAASEPSRLMPLSLLPEMRRSEEHTSELQSQSNLVCRLLLEKKKKTEENITSDV